jgi:cell division protein FtsQ
MKKIRFRSGALKLVGWTFTMIAFVVLMGFADRSYNKRTSSGLRITVKDAESNYFIEPVDIEEILNARGRKLRGMSMNDINIPMLEKLVYTNQYVDRAEVYSTIDGYVNIDVWQRNPVVRIINSQNEHYYIDEAGEFMPVSSKYSKPVVVANGYIFDRYMQKSLDFASGFPGDTAVDPLLIQVYEIARALREDEFWNSQIEQIYVNESFDIELIPRVGDHRIIIGTSEGLDEKLEKLMVFYEKAVARTGWNNYSVINLKYKDQVVCRKHN